MNKRIPVKAYRVRLYCDTCKNEMFTSSRTLLTNPQRFLYFCPKCGVQKSDTHIYPYIEYVDEEPSL